MMTIDVKKAVIVEDGMTLETAAAWAHSALRGAAEGSSLRAFIAIPVDGGRLDDPDAGSLSGQEPAVVIVVGGTHRAMCEAVGRMADGSCDSHLATVIEEPPA